MTNENQTKKFFIYARKSTDSEDRQVRSIADQLAELRELAKKENIEIVDFLQVGRYFFIQIENCLKY